MPMALMQKVHGGTYYVLFKDPRLPRKPHGSWKSTQTESKVTAERVDAELVALSENKSHWKEPEKVGVYLAATLRIWGRKTLGQRAQAIKPKVAYKDERGRQMRA